MSVTVDTERLTVERQRRRAAVMTAAKAYDRAKGRADEAADAMYRSWEEHHGNPKKGFLSHAEIGLAAGRTRARIIQALRDRRRALAAKETA